MDLPYHSPRESVEPCKSSAGKKIFLDPGQLELWKNFSSEADELLTRLVHELPWRQDTILIYGREVRIPRLQCWLAEPGLSYRYSGRQLTPTPFPQGLMSLRQRISDIAGVPFNNALCNFYRDGGDSMGWHADDEPELGPDPVIAAWSLGGTRRFALRRKQRRSGEQSRAFDLPHNSLLVMSRGVQPHWQHCIRKTKNAQPRISLTFRHCPL